MALAPTESMKQTSVQSRMIEWTDPKPFHESDASASSTWLFPFSSNMWLGDRVLDVSLCSVNWPKSIAHWSKQFHLHICSINKVYTHTLCMCATEQRSLTWALFGEAVLCFFKVFLLACSSSGFTPIWKQMRQQYCHLNLFISFLAYLL